MPESTSKPPADAVFRRSGRCASPRRTLSTAETRLTAVQSGHCGPVSSDVRHSGTHLHGFRMYPKFAAITASRQGNCPRFGAAADSQSPWCLTNRQGPSNELGRPDYGGRLTGTVISVDRGVRVGRPSCTGRSTESLRSVDRVVEVGRPTWVFQLTEKNLSSCARVQPVNFKKIAIPLPPSSFSCD